jgi:hypothetical protein
MLVSILDSFRFAETIVINPKVETPNSQVIFSDLAVSSIKPLSVIDIIGWDERTPLNRLDVYSASDSIIFDDSIERGHAVSVDDFLFIYDSTGSTYSNLASDILTFDESLTVILGAYSEDNLVYSDAARCNFVKYLSVIDSFTLLAETLALLHYKRDPELNQPVSPTPNYITLVGYDTESIQIRTPKFGDTETINLKRINRTTRGNTPIITKITNWTPTKLFKIDIESLSVVETENLRRFVRKNQGYPVDITDHNSVTRTVIFQQPDFETSNITRYSSAFTLDCYEVS